MINAPKIKSPYLRKCLNKKTLITKAIVLAIALVIVLIPSLTMYYWCLGQTSAQPWGTKGFIYINIIGNPGIGFGALDGNVPGIYCVQTFILLAMMAVYIFVTNDKISMSFIALAICGGAFNLFQRMVPWTFMGVTHYNEVLDYIKFGDWWKSFATFNFPDSFVVIGTFGFAISYIVVTIVNSVKEDKAEKSKKDTSNNSTNYSNNDSVELDKKYDDVNNSTSEIWGGSNEQ